MSSLASQLGQIAAKSNTVAFDRKRRQKIHSVSLVYPPSVAAAQDYEFIYANALQAFEELIELDSKFGFFKNSLFSETSISVDRNVQTAQQNKDLDKAINAYLSLVSSKWNLAPAIQATEWLVRRFQIQVHNAEIFLLSTINYYQKPFFKIILDICKLPPLLECFKGFQKSDRSLSNASIVKGFSDVDLFNLYAKYMQDSSRKNILYQNQVLFFTCTTINVIANASSDQDRMNKFIPLILEACAKFLITSSADAHVSSHTILAVLATASPLAPEVIYAATESILANVHSKAEQSALICIIKLFQSLNATEYESFPNRIYKMLIKVILQDQSRFEEIVTSKTIKSGKFITVLVKSILSYDYESNVKLILTILNLVQVPDYEMSYIIKDSIKAVDLVQQNKDDIVELFEFYIKNNEELLLFLLEKLNISIGILEVKLQASLQINIKDVKEVAENLEEIILDKKLDFKELVTEFESNKSKVTSFLAPNLNSEFNKLISLFTKACQYRHKKEFVSSVFPSKDSFITFITRVSISPSAPSFTRIASLKTLLEELKVVDSGINLSTLVPVLLTSLSDMHRQIRVLTSEVLKLISERKPTSKYYLEDSIYGPEKSQLISPKDGQALLEGILNNYFVENTDLSSLLKGLKKIDLYLAYFSSQASSISLTNTKLILCQIVTGAAENTKGASSSQIFQAFLEDYLSQRESLRINSEENKVDFKDFERGVLDIVSAKEKNEFAIQFLISCLNCPYVQLAELASNKVVKIFPTLKQQYQSKLAKAIVGAYGKDGFIGYDAGLTLQSIPLTAEIIIELLEDSQINRPNEEPGVAKRRRRSSASARQALGTGELAKIAEHHLQKVTVILETVDKNIDSIEPNSKLLSSLFNLLADLETLGVDAGLPVLYCQETLATTMTKMIRRLKDLNVKLSSNSIRTDIVVATIRASPSPQVQNRLLLVVAELASLSPETVLHSVMPIFTFMGAHTIRQDDEFSVHIVEQTVIRVIPALINASKDEKSKAEDVEFLLTSFASAFTHIPRHRRVKLFTTLASTFGAELSVHVILYLIGIQYSDSVSKSRSSESKALVDFSISFLKHFSAVEQVNSLNSFIKVWNKLNPSILESKDKQSSPLFSSLFLPGTTEEIISLKTNLIHFIDLSLVGNETSGISPLNLKIASVLLDEEVKDDVKQKVLTSFGLLIESLLEIIDSNSEVPIEELTALLNDVLSLLPIKEFVSSISTLLTNEALEQTIVQNLTLLSSNKFDLESAESEDAQEATETLINVLLKNVELKKSVLISQSSLDTTSSLVSKFGNKINPEYLINSLKLSTSELGLLNANGEIIISSLSLITNVVSVLGIKSIPFFPKIIPPTLKLFDEIIKLEENESKGNLELSILLLFSSFIKRIPAFMTTNLQDILRALFKANEVPEKIRTSIVQVIVLNMDHSTILKSLSSLWPEISKLNASSIGLFLNTLESTVEIIEKKTATTQAPRFFKLLIELFEFGSTSEFDNNTVHRIEASFHSVANAYVLKLNDKTFRPLFALLVRWAFEGEGVTSKSITEVERLTSFYKFFNKLQEHLKSIVTSYFTYFLEPTEKILTRFISEDLEDVNLRRIILNSLTSSFKYDQDEFWQFQSRFELISQVLLGQLININDSIGKYLVKSIAALAKSSSSDEHNKALNQLFISHMKADCKSREKLWAVRSLKVVYEKVGDQWLTLLPQIVPIIAELLEDDEEEVELEVRSGLIKNIEHVLGEPLDRYLN